MESRGAMARAHFEEYGFYSDDPPVRLKTEEDLELYSSIDQPTRTWLDSLEYIWSMWKKSTTVSQTLHEYFQTAPNPYLSCLRITVNTKDFFSVKSKSSLSYTVIEEFAKWIAPCKDNFKECLNVDMKTAAFRLVLKQKNLQVIRTVSDVYEFASDKEYFVNFIQDMISKKKYKDAGTYVEILKLQSSFANPETLLLPLILQNKTTVAEDILKNHPELQQSLVSYLDNLLAPDNNLQQIFDLYIIENDIPDIKFPYTQYKSVSKLVARLAKLYNVPSEICPFLNKKRGEGALQFLIYKRYVDGSLSIESWREMAKEAVGSDESLQIEILRSLCNANDPAEALYFAETYNVPRDEWPWYLKNYVDNKLEYTNNGEINDSTNEECWDTDNNISYYTLNLPRERIKIVDNVQSFEDFLDYGLKDVYLVGIDSEWKPTFSIKKPELALIQIATHTNVYILDVTVLGNSVPDLWSELGAVLLNNRNILKLGFGIANDISIFRESLPGLSTIRACNDGYMDLSHLWKKLLVVDHFVFPYEGDESFTNENLSKLAELCFGHRLDKSDQFSNWERRPLRESQIIYASLDAYCLLEIYDVLAKQCERLDIPFHEVCHHVYDHKSFADSESQKTPRGESKRSRNKYNLSNTQEFWSSVQQNGPSPSQNYENQEPSFSHQNFQPSNNGSLVKKAFSKVRAPRVHSSYHTAPPHQNQNHRHQQQQQPPPPSVSTPQQQQQQQQSAAVNLVSWPSLHDQQQRQTSQVRRFVCDSMLGGLVHQLRKCGLDCLFFDGDRGGELSYRASHDERRVLLTRHGNFHKFKQYLPPGYCYNVWESSKPEEQLAEVIRYYNIKINEADIFSRCQICNSNEFVYVSKDTMMELTQRCKKKTNSLAGPSSLNSADLYNHWDTEERAQQQLCNSSERQFSARSWALSYGTVNLASSKTRYNAALQLDQLPPNMLRHANNFYVCERCGKIYWYDSHIERALNGSLKAVLS